MEVSYDDVKSKKKAITEVKYINANPLYSKNEERLKKEVKKIQANTQLLVDKIDIIMS